MKKLLYFFTPFILILAFSFPVHASNFVDLSHTTLTVVEGGEEALTNGALSQYGLLPVLGYEIFEAVQYFLNKDPKLTTNDFHVRPLDPNEIDDFVYYHGEALYDRTGQPIPVNEIYYVEADNGFYHTEFYVDANGDMLFEDPAVTREVCNIGSNSKELSREFTIDFHNDFSFQKIN